mgnify:FL=1
MKDSEVLTSALAILNFAKTLSTDTLAVRNTEPIYPVTVGEHVVAYVLSLLLQHDWQEVRLGTIAEELIEILSQLDTGVDKPVVWQELFEVANRYSNG